MSSLFKAIVCARTALRVAALPCRRTAAASVCADHERSSVFELATAGLSKTCWPRWSRKDLQRDVQFVWVSQQAPVCGEAHRGAQPAISSWRSPGLVELMVPTRFPTTAPATFLFPGGIATSRRRSLDDQASRNTIGLERRSSATTMRPSPPAEELARRGLLAQYRRIQHLWISARAQPVRATVSRGGAGPCGPGDRVGTGWRVTSPKPRPCRCG